jgi:hypothetical protein
LEPLVRLQEAADLQEMAAMVTAAANSAPRARLAIENAR